MRIALLEPFAGVAGDMLVGALVHAGAPFAALRRGLASLPLKDFRVACREVDRCGVRARKYQVKFREHHHHRGLREILRILGKGRLPGTSRERAASAFRALAEAEARVHGIPVERVHFHEVGAVDAICDVVGAALALEALEVDRLYCRPLPLSGGFVEAEHGRMPVPAPATLELLKGLPTFDSGLSGELVTPTGAACVRAWATMASPPPFVPEAIGYGAGTRDPERYPNVCRVTVGEASEPRAGALCELVCDVDDATPQLLGFLLGRLLESGALDATLQPVVMKKDRPGTRIAVLARHESVPALEQILFLEGTTLGVRRRAVERTELPRRSVRVRTPYGEVRGKIGILGGKVVHAAPEYEDCRARAREAKVPLREVIAAAVARLRR